MKMFLEDKLVSWCDSFDVFDEIGRKLFRVNADPHGRRKLRIYDVGQRNKSVATLKECDEKAMGVEIKFGTRFVSAVRKFFSNLFNFFDLGFMGWCAMGDFGRGEFRILDANERTVAKIGSERTLAMTGEERNIGYTFMRCIDTLPEFYLHSLTFTLAIDVQTSDAALSAQSSPTSLSPDLLSVNS